MQLRRLTIENFRGYRQPTSISFGGFTSIVGRNDVGKSTLLEALDAFFNDRKPDADDVNVQARGSPTRITCEFEDLPRAIRIDANVATTLQEEMLLNATGFLEIVKEYDLSQAKPAPKIYARAVHPAVADAADLLQLTNAKLKTRGRDLGVDLTGVDERVNAALRAAIRAHVGNLQPAETLVSLQDAGAKKLWSHLQKDLPTYALFQADRQSRDDDVEIASPMDAAIKNAVKAVEAKLEEVKDEVKNHVEEVAKRTLAKLREMDATLADDLRPVFKAEPKWAGFKLSLNDHNDVPINKRGSGVRRLILLNFFRAEAERRQTERNAPGIIYAVEEPESSQHPSNQRMLINALADLSETGNTQVIVTTHVPGIAAMVPATSVRYVRRGADRQPTISDGNDDVLRLVADELGVLPDKRVKVLVYVEGPNDVAALEHLSRLTGHIDLTSDHRIAFVVTGGGNLRHWVTRHYLRELGLREVHIYDRDNDFGYGNQVAAVAARNNGDWATLTNKREIENYLHPTAITGVCTGINAIEVTDDNDVPTLVARAVHEASPAAKPWNEVEDAELRKKCSAAKRRLCSEAAAKMTPELLQHRDPNGDVQGWMVRIAEMAA
jgi:putative ATP-dependent endonuclease of OLD family